MAEALDPQAILADLVAKRDRLNAAISSLCEVYGLEPPDGSAGDDAVSAPNGQTSKARTTTAPPGIRQDTFFGLSVPNAVKKFLKLTREPKSPQAILEALQAGGQENPNYANVYTALKRMRATNEVRKLPNGDWGLAEWYGGPAAE